jgi:hypothetical protein
MEFGVEFDPDDDDDDDDDPRRPSARRCPRRIR